MLLQLLELLILARVILSWVVSPVSRNPFVVFVRSVTDVILNPIRAILPRTGMFDFSPMIALFALYFIENLISGMGGY
jgi:YggT family protein